MSPAELRALNTSGGKALHTTRKTRRCHTHTNLAESQNAVCLNGVGHDGDSPNAGSSDAFRVGGPNGGDEVAR